MSQGTSPTVHIDDGSHIKADGNIPEYLQDKELGDHKIAYQATDDRQIFYHALGSNVCKMLTLGEQKAKLTSVNITNA